jgi:hypothetical protein
MMESSARAVADPAAACTAIKARAVGKNAYDQMKCQATAAREDTVDPVCIQKAEGKLTVAFARAEQSSGCPAVGSGRALEELDAFAAAAVAALPAVVTTTTTTTTTSPPHPPCPGGALRLNGFLSPTCWYAGTLGQSCDQVCAGVGRTSDPATATFAGSEGSDVGCLEVLAALNPLPVDQINVLFTDRSADCGASGLDGLGCFSRADSAGGVASFGRCAMPVTTGTASAPGYARVCACQ